MFEGPKNNWEAVEGKETEPVFPPDQGGWFYKSLQSELEMVYEALRKKPADEKMRHQ